MAFLLGSLLLEEEDPDGLDELEDDDPEGLEELDEDELLPAAAAAAFAFSRSLSFRACFLAFWRASSDELDEEPELELRDSTLLDPDGADEEEDAFTVGIS
jgi:hypothetical protein